MNVFDHEQLFAQIGLDPQNPFLNQSNSQSTQAHQMQNQSSMTLGAMLSNVASIRELPDEGAGALNYYDVNRDAEFTVG